MKSIHQRLRITSGKLKGKGLYAPDDIRPTAEKVRQALINILQAIIPDAVIIDGFAGSGALGFESLSRGAAKVIFIEEATDSIMAIRRNLELLEEHIPRTSYRLMHLDILKGIKQLEQMGVTVDLVFLDPPYASDLGKKALNHLASSAILGESGIVVLEHDRRDEVPSEIGSMSRVKQHRYGTTVLSLYQKHEGGSAEQHLAADNENASD